MKAPAIYILTNRHNGTLYIGVTSKLTARIAQHKEKAVAGFSNKYNLDKLVYYELIDTMYDAITREKQLKNWRRQWKIDLIEKFNPTWRDLSEDLQ
jgi:putative endonuclease